MQKIFFLILLSVTSLFMWAQEPHIIPRPAALSVKKGFFDITKETVVVTSNEQDKKAADFFNEYLGQLYGFKLRSGSNKAKNYIRLVTKTFVKAPGKDAYTLVATKDGVQIEGDTYAGTFYGIQSLIQLLPVGEKAAVAKLTKLSIPLARSEEHTSE